GVTQVGGAVKALGALNVGKLSSELSLGTLASFTSATFLTGALGGGVTIINLDAIEAFGVTIAASSTRLRCFAETILLGHFQDVLKTSAAVKEFHNISQMFVKNKYNPEPYYEHCLVALGDKFNDVFPELLALLPDIGKQQELFLVHVQREKGLNRMGEAIIDVCSICKQVLVRNDLFAHLQAHKLESNFPLLTK
uniref:ZNF598/HEL2 PAH domain-containing protein n=1 Tax=Phlebotomus papatasi TaxID=29031 RepID=A0A1B0D2D5_PHLPP